MLVELVRRQVLVYPANRAATMVKVTKLVETAFFFGCAFVLISRQTRDTDPTGTTVAGTAAAAAAVGDIFAPGDSSTAGVKQVIDIRCIELCLLQGDTVSKLLFAKNQT